VFTPDLLAVFRPAAYKTTVFKDCSFKTSVLKEPLPVKYNSGPHGQSRKIERQGRVVRVCFYFFTEPIQPPL
jgi:hypothetical protein